ncbi:MbnP family protein [Dyadobacter sp. NIV53]|uniref:MbnP family protein n=1 Tax=Dyadobacter sp. NIV53 TaxID=2861765 RepID=UPI001C86B659|nr:MbnP family protein [Dyadobacter sp. NIV53]
MKFKFSSIYLFLSLIALSFVLTSCNDDNDPVVDPATTGSLRIEFDNIVGDRDLVLNTGTYKNAANQPFTVTKLNYYVSNIKLLMANGSSFVVPQDSSYFLIREADAESQEVTINNVPSGEYTGVEFMIGVDSLRSVADASKRKGILDTGSGPTNEEAMYWDWNPGYIFLKIEGTSDSTTSANGKYYYHIGGFGGRTEKTINNLRTAKVDFGGKKAIVTPELSPEVHLMADVLKIFSGSTQLSISKYTSVMFEDYSKNIADNYVNMFTLDHIHAD